MQSAGGPQTCRCCACLVRIVGCLLVVAAGCMAGLELGRTLGPCAAQGLRGWLTCRTIITPPTNGYWEGRKESVLYSRSGIVQRLARQYAADALTMLDVGSYVPNIVASFDWVPTKVATDIQADRRMGWNATRGVAFVKGDFLAIQFATHFDLVTCTQVLEHFTDSLAQHFVRRMQRLSRPAGGLLIVSVPFEMPNTWIPCRSASRSPAACKGHLQDPLGSSEFASWFNQSVPGAIVAHVVKRGRIGVRGQQTWANGTRIAASYQVVAWRRH